MTFLEELNVADNLLLTLPPELGLLLHLEILDLRGNPLEGIAPGTQTPWSAFLRKGLGDELDVNLCSPAARLSTTHMLPACRTAVRGKALSYERRKNQTAAVLDCLRRVLPDEVRTELTIRLEAIRIRKITVILRRQFCSADACALRESMDLAASAGIPSSDESMKLAARALKISEELEAAAGSNSTKELHAAVRRWQEYRRDLELNQPVWMKIHATQNSNGPDLEAAQRRLRQLRMKEMATEFRTRNRVSQYRAMAAPPTDSGSESAQIKDSLPFRKDSRTLPTASILPINQCCCTWSLEISE